MKNFQVFLGEKPHFVLKINKQNYSFLYFELYFLEIKWNNKGFVLRLPAAQDNMHFNIYSRARILFSIHCNMPHST
jgi:hypothetical protein